MKRDDGHDDEHDETYDDIADPDDPHAVQEAGKDEDEENPIDDDGTADETDDHEPWLYDEQPLVQTTKQNHKSHRVPPAGFTTMREFDPDRTLYRFTALVDPSKLRRHGYIKLCPPPPEALPFLTDRMKQMLGIPLIQPPPPPPPPPCPPGIDITDSQPTPAASAPAPPALDPMVYADLIQQWTQLLPQAAVAAAKAPEVVVPMPLQSTHDVGAGTVDHTSVDIPVTETPMQNPAAATAADAAASAAATPCENQIHALHEHSKNTNVEPDSTPPPPLIVNRTPPPPAPRAVPRESVQELNLRRRAPTVKDLHRAGVDIDLSDESDMLTELDARYGAPICDHKVQPRVKTDAPPSNTKCDGSPLTGGPEVHRSISGVKDGFELLVTHQKIDRVRADGWNWTIKDLRKLERGHMSQIEAFINDAVSRIAHLSTTDIEWIQWARHLFTHHPETSSITFAVVFRERCADAHQPQSSPVIVANNESTTIPVVASQIELVTPVVPSKIEPVIPVLVAKNEPPIPVIGANSDLVESVPVVSSTQAIGLGSVLQPTSDTNSSVNTKADPNHNVTTEVVVCATPLQVLQSEPDASVVASTHNDMLRNEPAHQQQQQQAGIPDAETIPQSQATIQPMRRTRRDRGRSRPGLATTCVSMTPISANVDVAAVGEAKVMNSVATIELSAENIAYLAQGKHESTEDTPSLSIATRTDSKQSGSRVVHPDEPADDALLYHRANALPPSGKEGVFLSPTLEIETVKMLAVTAALYGPSTVVEKSHSHMPSGISATAMTEEDPAPASPSRSPSPTSSRPVVVPAKRSRWRRTSGPRLSMYGKVSGFRSRRPNSAPIHTPPSPPSMHRHAVVEDNDTLPDLQTSHDLEPEHDVEAVEDDDARSVDSMVSRSSSVRSVASSIASYKSDQHRRMLMTHTSHWPPMSTRPPTQQVEDPHEWNPHVQPRPDSPVTEAHNDDDHADAARWKRRAAIVTGGPRALDVYLTSTRYRPPVQGGAPDDHLYAESTPLTGTPYRWPSRPTTPTATAASTSTSTSTQRAPTVYGRAAPAPVLTPYHTATPIAATAMVVASPSELETQLRDVQAKLAVLCSKIGTSCSSNNSNSLSSSSSSCIASSGSSGAAASPVNKDNNNHHNKDDGYALNANDGHRLAWQPIYERLCKDAENLPADEHKRERLAAIATIDRAIEMEYKAGKKMDPDLFAARRTHAIDEVVQLRREAHDALLKRQEQRAVAIKSHQDNVIQGAMALQTVSRLITPLVGRNVFNGLQKIAEEIVTSPGYVNALQAKYIARPPPPPTDHGVMLNWRLAAGIFKSMTDGPKDDLIAAGYKSVEQKCAQGSASAQRDVQRAMSTARSRAHHHRHHLPAHSLDNSEKHGPNHHNNNNNDNDNNKWAEVASSAAVAAIGAAVGGQGLAGAAHAAFAKASERPDVVAAAAASMMSGAASILQPPARLQSRHARMPSIREDDESRSMSAAANVGLQDDSTDNPDADTSSHEKKALKSSR